MFNFINSFIYKCVKMYLKKYDVKICTDEDSNYLSDDDLENKIKDYDEKKEYEKYINQYW